MRKLFAALSMFLVVAAPLTVEAAPIHGFEANAPRSERQDSSAPRSREANAPRGEDASAPRADRESNAPRSPESSAPDSIDQGNPAP
jgi:hypothetical protein